MRRLIFILSFLLPLIFHSVAFCDELIVYGDGFSFVVSEPANWTGDSSNAIKLNANIIFYTKQRSENPAIIRVRVNSKLDENTNEDLNYDMEQYKTKYPEINFKNISVTHPRYSVYPKLFYIPNDFYEYVTYINPGPDFNKMFSVSMNIQKREATEDEFNAYKKVIESLLFITEDVNIEK